MKIIHLIEAAPCFADYHTFFVASGSPVTIGDNPSLPGIISKTWKWPPISVAFFIDNQCCATYTGVRIGKAWVSLPHFDNGALWVNSVYLHKISLFTDENRNFNEWKAREFFYFRIYDVLSQMQSLSNKWCVIHAFLEQDDFSSNDYWFTRSPDVKLQCRSIFPLLSYRNNIKVTSSISLKDSYEEQYYSFNGNVRRKINKSKRNGIKLVVGGIGLTDRFYQVYRKNIQQLGSFGLPKRFFINLLSNYQNGDARIILATLDGKCVGAAIFLSYLNHSENSWFATLREANKYYVSYALHDQMIRLAISNACKTYSFGRSTMDSTVHQYKKQWGVQDQTLYFNSTYPVGVNVRKFDFARKFIKRMPLRIACMFDGFISGMIY